MEETPLLVGLDGKSPLLVTAAARIPNANLPDAQQLLLGGQHTWGVFSVESGTWSPTASELVSIHDVAFSPDGSRLLFAGGTPSQSGIVELWDWNTRTRQAKVAAHDDVVYSVAWSPSGEYWCTASADQKCKVYRLDQHEVGEFVEHSKAVLDAQFLNTDAGELQIVSAGVDTTIQVWNALDGQRIRTLENHTHSVQQIVLLPRGASALERLISIGQDKTVRLWQPTIGRLVKFGKTLAKPSAMAVGDANHIWVGFSDGSVWLVATDTMAPVWKGVSKIGMIREIVPISDTHIWIAGTHGNLSITRR